MLHFPFFVLLAAYATDVVLAARQPVPTSPPVCSGYLWGVTIERLYDTPIPVYNQYVRTTAYAGPVWVQSSTVSTPPSSITLWGTKYDCQVPKNQTYYCDKILVATCCGDSTTSA